MAWVTPTNVATGDVLTASKWNQDVVENWNALGGAWTSYTPTWTNLTVGSASQEFAYIAIGKMHIVRAELTLNGSTVTGQPEFTLPNGVSVNSQYSDTAPLGMGFLFDSSAAAGVVAYLVRSSSTAARCRWLSISTGFPGGYTGIAGVGATAPFTWANSDRLEGQFMFEAA